MINRQISLGTLITILTILSTFIFTLGATSNKIKSLELDINNNEINISDSQEKQQELEVSLIRLETKLDEWGKRLETLIININE
tara:strand:- start:1910 stop:2161 length:252 start_codon:yes stop_codon:yes gene_type:complete